MARSCVAEPFFAAIPRNHQLRRRRNMATISPIITTTTTIKWPPLRRPHRPSSPTTTPESNDVSINDNEESKENAAADVLRLMDALRLPADEELYISLIKECTATGDAAQGAAVHTHITASHHSGCGGGGISLPLANRLLLMYAACGEFGAARELFDEMPVRNSASWATMVAAYSDGGIHRDAMRVFAGMRCEVAEHFGGWCGHAVLAVLRSCARAEELGLGEQIHALAVKMLGANGAGHGDVGSSLVQFYCSLGRQATARQVLEMMKTSRRDLVPEAAWTSMITACHRDGLLDEAADIFRDMTMSGNWRSSFSLSSILAVCAEMEDGDRAGQQAHADAIKLGIDADQFVRSSLVHMYAKQGRPVDAVRSFEAVTGMPDAACWNALLMAYARGGWHRETIRVLYEMKAAGMQPSELMIRQAKMACFN